MRNRRIVVLGLAAITAVALADPKEEAVLTAGADAKVEGYFGRSVAIDGDTLFVGALGNSFGSQGSAFVFERAGTSWSRVQRLTGDSPDNGYSFGLAVAVRGDLAVVGSPTGGLGTGNRKGTVYTYERVGGTWTFGQRLDGEGDERDDFGVSLALSGDTLLVGAMNHGGRGAVFAFTRSGGQWGQRQKLTPGDATFSFGGSVALSGDTAIVGSANDDDEGLNSGSAYVFERTAGVWSQTRKFTSGEPGAESTYFGTSVALSGDTAVVGAMQRVTQVTGGSATGVAYVYRREGAVWTQEARLTPPAGHGASVFGAYAALEGDLLAVGAPRDDNFGTQKGAVYVLRRSGVTWTQLSIVGTSAVAQSSGFGAPLALSGTTLVTAAGGDDAGFRDAGSARVYSGIGTGGGGGGGNQPPALVLPVIAAPDHAVVGTRVGLLTLATDADRDRLTYEWHFGDGTTQATGRRSRATKKYAAPGSYDVFVRVTDAKGGVTDSAPTTVTVVAPGTPYFDVGKLSLRLSFKKTGKDTIRVSGQFPLADGTAFAGKSFVAAVEGITIPFTLDASGRSPKGPATVRVTAPKNGVARFTVTMNGSYAAALAAAGIANATVKNVPATIHVVVTLDGVPFAEDFTVVYAGKAGKQGAAK